MSGFFLDRLVCFGWVAVIRRMVFVDGRWSVIFWSISSVLKFSGMIIERSSSAGGSGIHASVRFLNPYGVLPYVRIPHMRIGGVSTTVAARMTSLPKFGLRFLSSMVKT